MEDLSVSQLLTFHQAALRAGFLSEGSLRARAHRGALPTVNIGGRVFVTVEALEQLLREEGVK